MEHTFAALPKGYKDVVLVDDAGKAVRQVLWGDWLWIDDSQPDTDPVWRHIVWSPNDSDMKKLRIKREHTTDNRPLEIIFVDVGQGDGAVLITPEPDADERIIVIDAGEGPEMSEFLEKRFIGYRDGFTFHAAVITHPDKDHYFGFRDIFASGVVKFDNVYHSCLCERPVSGEWPKLGGLTDDGGRKYVEDLVEDDARFRQIFSAPAGEKDYPTVIKAALDNGAVGKFKPLSTEHGQKEGGKSWLPEFAPSSPREYEIEVLGPVVEKSAGGTNRLRKLGGYAETKNGHSVILRLAFKNFRILFGGDLNRRAEEFLLPHYAGLPAWPPPAGRPAMVIEAGKRLRSEVLKVCHHGSADVTDEFLDAVNPAAFVISSGDEEGHVHPRPDLLGRLGRKGRGDAPVLLSTELQRSGRAREDAKLVEKLKKDIVKQSQAPTDDRQVEIDEAIKTLSRSNVDVDGAIYVKTDGDRMIAAFKKESGSDTDKWFYFEYLMDNDELKLAPR
jgi:beta-lactamase superfamily II metal-dependent hydrolase